MVGYYTRYRKDRQDFIEVIQLYLQFWWSKADNNVILQQVPNYSCLSHFNFLS